MPFEASLRAFRSKNGHTDLDLGGLRTLEKAGKFERGGDVNALRRRFLDGLAPRGLQPSTLGRQRKRKNAYHCIEIPPRSVWIGTRRTSIRLEPEFWEALDEIARIEHTDACGVLVEIERIHGRSRFASKVRVAILSYFRPEPIALVRRLAKSERRDDR